MSGITSIETLLFNVRLSIRYHSSRREFFDSANLFCNFLSVVLGSAAVVALVSAEFRALGPWLTAAGAVSSALNLVFRFAERARIHHDLVRRFIQLEQKVLPAQDDHLVSLFQEKLNIETEEPPLLKNLAILCHNEQARAEGVPKDKTYLVSSWQRLCKHFWDVGETPKRISEA